MDAPLQVLLATTAELWYVVCTMAVMMMETTMKMIEEILPVTTKLPLLYIA